MEWAAGEVVRSLSWEVCSWRLDDPFVCREGGGDVNWEYLLTAPPSPKIIGLCERWCNFLPPYPARFTWLKETEGEVGKQRVKE